MLVQGNSEYCANTTLYQQEQKSDPFTGIAAEGYTGKGQIQSPPAST